MKSLIKQFAKFGVVGVIAFVIDYGLLVFLTEICSINYLVSATLSFSVAVVFNYLASMRYVFSHRPELDRRKEFVIFVVLSVVGLLINDFIMWLGTDIFGVTYLITKLIATVIVALWNFFSRKRFLDAGSQPA